MDDAIYVIDRIEEGIAVLVGDSGEKAEIPLSGLPSGAHEGSCLRSCEHGFALDEGEAGPDSKFSCGRRVAENAS